MVQKGVKDAMRCPAVKLIFFVVCMTLLTRGQAFAQDSFPIQAPEVKQQLNLPAEDPSRVLNGAQALGSDGSKTPAEDPVSVIHQDLPSPGGVEEPQHPGNRFWFQADYWMAWIRGATFPTLVTNGASSDPLPGALGQPETMVRFGGEPTPEVRSGALSNGLVVG